MNWQLFIKNATNSSATTLCDKILIVKLVFCTNKYKTNDEMGLFVNISSCLRAS